MASILETFYIMFKTDSSDVKKGSEEAKLSVNKLNDSLKNTNTVSQQINQSFANMSRMILGAAAAFISVHSVVGGIKDAFTYTLQLQQASRALNINATELDAWGRVAERAGGSAQGFQQSIKSLAAHLNIRNQDAFALLPRLADIFKKAGNERSVRFGQRLGLDESTILMLQQGRREVEAAIARQKELGVVTTQDTEVVKRFNSAWQDMTFAFRETWIRVAGAVLPIMTAIADKLTAVAKYFRKHSNLIVGGLIAIGIAAGILAIPFILANVAVIGLTAAIVVLVATFALVYEDFKAFQNHWDSLIGKILEKFPVIRQLIEYLSAIRNLYSFFIGTSASSNELIVKGNSAIDAAARTPLGLQTNFNTSNSRSSQSRNSTIYTGPITINAPGGDGGSIAKALQDMMNTQFRQATGTIDDGVLG